MILFRASIAKLETSLAVYGDKLELRIHGFSEKLPLLLYKILDVAKTFAPKEDRFKVIKEEVERNLRNANIKPLNHAPYLRLQVLCKISWDVDEKLQCLSNLTFPELQTFIPKLLSQLYYQIGQEHGVDSIKVKGLSDLFDEVIQESLFNQLRTKEQLGYVVECGPQMTFRVFGFCFCVQSSKYNPIHLQSRIDNFIDGLEVMMESLDDESFENFKSGLTARLLEKDPSLTYETNRLWSQIVDKRYMFDMSEKEAQELRNIKKSDLIEWYNTYFQRVSPRCRRLAVRVWGCNTDLKEAEMQRRSMQVIDDPTAFKMSSSFYPSIC